MPRQIHPAHARRAVHEAEQEVKFNRGLAVRLAGEIFPGVEEYGLNVKVHEVLQALVQSRLDISRDQLAGYHSMRAVVEQKYAPRQVVSEAAFNEATEHVAAVKETLECERVSLYTALLLHSGVEEAERSFKAAQAVVDQAEEQASKAKQELSAARARREQEAETLQTQLETFDGNNAIIVAFLAWSKQRLATLKSEHDEMAEYGPR